MQGISNSTKKSKFKKSERLPFYIFEGMDEYIEKLPHVSEWLSKIRKQRGSSDQSIEQYKIFITHIARTLDLEDLSNITFEQTDEYHSILFEDGLSLALRQKALYILISFLKSRTVNNPILANAISKDIIPRGTSANESLPEPIRYISDIPDALEKIDDYISHATPNVKAMLTMLRYYGLRASEVAELRVKDFDRDTLTVFVRRGKGHKKRQVPPPEGFDEIIEKLMTPWLEMRDKQNPKPDDHLLLTKRQGRHYQRRGLSATAKEIAFRILGEGFPAHKFRHLYASWLATLRYHDGNIIYSPTDIKVLMGHTSELTTSKYLHKFYTNRKMARKKITNECSEDKEKELLKKWQEGKITWEEFERYKKMLSS